MMMAVNISRLQVVINLGSDASGSGGVGPSMAGNGSS